MCHVDIGNVKQCGFENTLKSAELNSWTDLQIYDFQNEGELTLKAHASAIRRTERNSLLNDRYVHACIK